MSANPYDDLPSVAAVLAESPLVELRDQFPQYLLTEAVRAEIALLREAIARGEVVAFIHIATSAASRLLREALPKLREVINATGIVLHTNLGRAPLAEEAARAAYEAGRGYLNLELSLDTGERSSRQSAVEAGIVALTGAEAATVVNNCAAATVLVLRALAAGREVVVSRGQLVEIGGGFRIPEIMAASGATLREVGTTNITRLADYANAVGPQTALLMRIHTSNYHVRGHTAGVGIGELAELAHAHGLLAIDDVGSGAAIDLRAFGLPAEPGVAEGLAAGADLVLFSGDKLLGGPQAGLIAGRRELVRRLERDPLMRAFRTDKMTLAALEATLRLYRDPARAVREIPTLRMLTTPREELRTRATILAAGIGEPAVVRDDVSFAGGGSLPEVELPTSIVAVPAGIAAKLRLGTPAILGRVRDGELRLDPRTVFPRQEVALIEAVRAALR